MANGHANLILIFDFNIIPKKNNKYSAEYTALKKELEKRDIHIKRPKSKTRKHNVLDYAAFSSVIKKLFTIKSTVVK